MFKRYLKAVDHMLISSQRKACMHLTVVRLLDADNIQLLSQLDYQPGM